jgi:hypothetical protein
MALQSVDLVVALTAARTEARQGAWKPADVQRALDLPWSTLDRSLDRLRRAAILRGGHVSRIALASLLPALRYLFPLEVDVTHTEVGVPTSYASAAFEGRIRYTVPEVWPDATGSVAGHPVVPLHPGLPNVARRHPDLGAVFALVDAVRGGRVREVHLAIEKLRELLDLPTPYASA